ncbi:MAG TPA: hypothetical protein ENK06_12035 [Gammaproteobacteria bacterium]|nr:hypothetical protein [Gammaproteobacteria bacterium]
MLRLIGIFLCFAYASQVNAARLPQWELGLAAGYVKLPYYRGAASARDIVLPLPLVIYREKAKDARRTFLGSKRVSWALSLGATLPVPEGDAVVARSGMPGLDATLEFGPGLNISLWKSGGHHVSAVLPSRLVNAVSFSRIAYQGWKVSPYLLYSYQKQGKNGWKFQIAAGPVYAAKAYHDYYYAVDLSSVRNKRRFFETKQGYSGSRISLYGQKRFNRLWLSAFARVDILSGAVFEGSPLLERKTSIITGFVIGWVFKKSPNRIYVDD